ncbi:nuclear factor related to kappa-B-binding protein-like [Sinocyclocheilus grahami]|uniref:nuclear factor related to kappa-B-binding protein-like n=1 Tax=Sinocyclocheilus grahami TaxID=75366 RepID=UPI0007ACEABB|nr:PREDICTED: nuclear factor related to kappa-B-binding protein-like [Sinocyclocheilus grahami]
MVKMDALDHVLTDPLESGMDQDGRVMEECMLGNCRVRVPEDLLEDPEIFFSVMSESTWTDVLTDAQRTHLCQLLPQFSENNISEQNSIISELFNNQNYFFGNPLHIAQKLFRGYSLFLLFSTFEFLNTSLLIGYFNPEVVKYRQLCAKSQKKRHIYSLQQYYHKLLKQILVSRKELLDLAVRSGPELAVKRRYPAPSHKEMLEQRVRHRVGHILKGVKTECGDSNVSSDEDDTASWFPVPQSPSSTTPTVSLRVLPSLSTQDMKTRDKPELGEKELRAMLHRHREKRKRQPIKGFLDCVNSYISCTTSFKYVKTTNRVHFFTLICTGPSQEVDKDLSALCQLWLESKDHVIVKQEGEETTELTPPTPRVWTDYVVRPSTGEERHVFQEQEQQRYDQPHKAFTYRMHGFESVVGPVKGVFDKETSLNKAREHSLLRSDRPAYVTILSLVRDAAARLPNGEGTRAEICELLKDSQFLAPDVTSAQVNTVVSGALDRLHYEKDPCVKYDIGHKLWIYLHRDRSQEEFERIHQAQAAAAKAKKALQQKSKPAPKPKACGKEPEAAQSSGSEVVAIAAASLSQPPSTPTSSTPGTPKSPLPPTAATPIKVGAPEPVKTNPSVLLVSPPSMPPLGTLLSASQPGPQVSQQASPQPATRVVAHSAATGSLPQVRVVTAQAGLQTSSAGQAATLVHQSPHHIRVPVTVAHGKSITQAVVTLPLRGHSAGSPIQVQSSRGQASLAVPGLASTVTVTKHQTSSPASPPHNPTSPAVLQGVSSQNIIKQVAITGQLGVKTQSGAGIPLTATNLRIQGKDVLRLPSSSITTDAKGQTVLRITPDMMATLTKSPVATVKLTPDMLSSAMSSGSKSISATLHVSAPQPSPPTSNTAASATAENLAAKAPATLVKVHPELKAACDTTIRLMPALAVTMADPKARTYSSVTSSDAKAGTTIRIVPNLGVIPQKQGQTVSISTTTSTKPVTVSSGAATVTIATSGVGGAKKTT